MDLLELRSDRLATRRACRWEARLLLVLLLLLLLSLALLWRRLRMEDLVSAYCGSGPSYCRLSARLSCNTCHEMLVTRASNER